MEARECGSIVQKIRGRYGDIAWTEDSAQANREGGRKLNPANLLIRTEMDKVLQVNKLLTVE